MAIFSLSKSVRGKIRQASSSEQSAFPGKAASTDKRAEESARLIFPFSKQETQEPLER